MIYAALIWAHLTTAPFEDVKIIWTLRRVYQLDNGIHYAPDLPGFSTEEQCLRVGEAWLRKQPERFDWYSAIDCFPVEQVVRPRRRVFD